jgi:hypothetical protein
VTLAQYNTARQHYGEALGWGITGQEVEHIVTHHPLEKARTLLWKARRPADVA